MASRLKEGIKELFSSKDDLDYPSSYNQQRMFTSQNGRNTQVPVLELRVPMCCEKCQEKVKEALEECEGVRDVICDQYNQRVTVTGFVDPLKALRRVKRVKKKSEFFNDSTYINRTSHPIGNGVGNGLQSRSMHVPLGASQTHYTSNPLVRTHSNGFARFPHEGQMAAMTPIRRQVPVMMQPRQLMPVNSYRTRPQALAPVNLQRDFTGIRRMPSFKNYRHHDAEYISMGDDFRPSMAETHYISNHNQRPSGLRSQISFSNIPVTNPHYMKHIESEYY